MGLRRVIEEEPRDYPDKTQRTCDDEGDLPVIGEDRPGDERRRDHRAEGRADVEDAAGEASLACRKPFGGRFHARGIGGAFRKSERAAKEVLALPMFPELTEAEQQWVVESIAEFYS